MKHVQHIAKHIRPLKTWSLLALLLFSMGRANSQTIELLGAPQDSTGTYWHMGLPIVYKGKLYMQCRNSANNQVLVGYDGNTFTVFPSPQGFDAGYRGYLGNPVIYHDTLYLQYMANNSVKNLARFDGNSLVMIDNPSGYGSYLGYPVVYHDKLYLKFDNTLMAFEGGNFQPFDVPAEYKGANLGYRGGPVLHGDKLYLLFYRQGEIGDLAYVTDTSLIFIPSPAGFDGQYSGYQGGAISAFGKLFARYQNNAGGYALGILEQDSLRFRTIPDSLGGPQGLQDTYFAAVLDDQLLLNFQLSGGNFSLGTYRDTSFRLIPSPPGFEAANTGIYGSPLAYQGLAYCIFYNEAGKGRTVIFDGNQLNLIAMPGNDQEASLGEDGEFFAFDGKVYTRYTKDGISRLAALAGYQATLFDHPQSTMTVSYIGQPVIYNGALYFRYLESNNAVLARLNTAASTAPDPLIANALTLYPNPCHDGRIALRIDHALDGPLRIQVFDLQGRCQKEFFHQKSNAPSQVPLDLSGLPAGLYTVCLQQAGQYRAVRLVLISG